LREIAIAGWGKKKKNFVYKAQKSDNLFSEPPYEKKETVEGGTRKFREERRKRL